MASTCHSAQEGVGAPAALDLVRLRIQLEVREPARLPPFLGSTLRGALAMALRRAACAAPVHQRCAACPLAERCVYARLFEPQVPAGSPWMSSVDDAPRPYVIEPPGSLPDAPGLELARGDSLGFGLLLVGRAIEAVPFLLAAARHMAEQGLGARRHRFRLQAAEVEEPLGSGSFHPFFDGAGERFAGTVQGSRWSFAPLPEDDDGPCQAALQLCAPLRLQSRGRLVRDAVPFELLVTTLLRRASSLATFHGAGHPELAFAELARQAEAVRTVRSELRWVEGARRSNRQQREVPLGGLFGTLAYEGELAPLVPLLRLGEQIHVGKGTVFGLGRYRLAGV